MANEGLVNLLSWCKRERESMQMQREMLQSGRFRVHEKDENGALHDISDQNIKRLTDNMAELDLIMNDYQARGEAYPANLA